jgi:hypothetical protein
MDAVVRKSLAMRRLVEAEDSIEGEYRRRPKYESETSVDGK